MAAQDTPAFDDLTPVKPGNDYDDEEEGWIELDRGESVVGEIREISPNCGQYNTTVINLATGIGEVRPMWSNRQIDRALESRELAEGDVIGIKHTDETRSFTPDGEDEETEYDVWEVREQ